MFDFCTKEVTTGRLTRRRQGRRPAEASPVRDERPRRRRPVEASSATDERAGQILWLSLIIYSLFCPK
ncbi:unnamed protein product [Linum trigynum]|uniref:Uncharacterized protein n=1 Tax=Linum trigynum TaxID=586398 RepID=A0AAV2G7H4_9ROSI